MCKVRQRERPCRCREPTTLAPINSLRIRSFLLLGPSLPRRLGSVVYQLGGMWGESQQQQQSPGRKIKRGSFKGIDCREESDDGMKVRGTATHGKSGCDCIAAAQLETSLALVGVLPNTQRSVELRAGGRGHRPWVCAAEHWP